MKRARIKIAGHSTTAELKKEIQALVRGVVIRRDGTCILRDIRHCDDPVLQADHLVTRANSATFSDTRLIVCLCRSCHGWKHYHKEQYDALVRTLLPKERVKLWDKAMEDSWMPKRVGASDWRMEIVALKQELGTYPHGLKS